MNKPTDIDSIHGICDAAMFRWLDESSTIDEARAIARCHGYELVVRIEDAADVLPPDLAEAYERGEQVFDRWHPEPPEPGLTFAGKYDTEDGEIVAKWLRPLTPEQHAQWQSFLAISLKSEGSVRIALERHRQITVEHYSTQHDDDHSDSSLSLAGGLMAIYAATTPPHDHHSIKSLDACRIARAAVVKLWPWGKEHFKPKDALRTLEIAGALIAADIDRLIRAKNAADRANAVRHAQPEA